MEYKVGSPIRFRLYTGREVDGVIQAIVKTMDGERLRVAYGNNLATISSAQIVQPEKPDTPDNVEF
jgi:transcriptional regulator